MPHESKIRDYLADHLECLEEGLCLIKKEYPLQNPLGASGKVDILAKDKYGLHVIIEIKRSNQASRQALHELHKYVALLQSNMGVDIVNIRCIVVSTTWHELLVPFSEYFNSSNHSVEGFQITTTESGRITQIQKVEPIQANNALEICPEHMVYLFERKESLSLAYEQLTNGLLKLKIRDFCIIELIYSGLSESIIYPNGLYVAISAFNEVERSEFAKKLKIDLSDINPEESPYYTEQMVLGELGKHVCPFGKRA